MSAWRRIARIVKPRNVDGSLSVQSTEGLPFLLEEGMHVWFVPPLMRGPREADCVAVAPLAGDAWAVRFSGIDDAETAGLLSGRYCLVAKADLPEDFDADDPLDDLRGWTVDDERFGPLGSVSDIIDGPMQSLLQVEGERGDVLIPLVEEFIIELDEEERRVRTRVPDGLLELNVPTEGE